MEKSKGGIKLSTDDFTMVAVVVMVMVVMAVVAVLVTVVVSSAHQ